MNEGFGRYLDALVSEVPLFVYVGLFSVFIVGSIILWQYGRCNFSRNIIKLILADYLILIYCSTVFFREASSVRKYNLTPFWSYKAIEIGHRYLFAENVMNVIVFLPIGVLLGALMFYERGWKVLLAGLIISISIEVLQFMTKRGFCELDDVMHNMLGCLIGFLLMKGFMKGWRCVLHRHSRQCTRVI